MKKYLYKVTEGLVSDEMPVVMEYGSNCSQVPLNIQQIEVSDENGEPKTAYTCDLVDNVNNPVDFDNILIAMINAKYSETEQNQIQDAINKGSNSNKVKAYKAYLKACSDKIEASGYNK